MLFLVSLRYPKLDYLLIRGTIPSHLSKHLIIIGVVPNPDAHNQNFVMFFYVHLLKKEDFALIYFP